MQQPANSHSIHLHIRRLRHRRPPHAHVSTVFSFPAHKMTKSSINSVIVRFLLFRFSIRRCANVCTDGPESTLVDYSLRRLFFVFNFNYSIAFLITVTVARFCYATQDRTPWKTHSELNEPYVAHLMHNCTHTASQSQSSRSGRLKLN